MMIASSIIGPKGHLTTQAEPSAEEIKYLSAVLNSRQEFFYAAQQDRGRKERRDRAVMLIEELRRLMPEIAKDAEEQRVKADDFFSRKAERAAQSIFAFIASDVFTTALPPVDLPDSVRGWQWCGRSLYADVEQIIGANPAARFLVAAIQKLTGENPKLSAVATWLKQQINNS